MSLLTLWKLQEANEERNKVWDPQGKLTPLFFAVELGGECGEALNIIKKLEREVLELPSSRSSPAALAEELADVVIVAALLANCFDIDLGMAVKEKFNETSSKLDLKVFL